MRPSGITAMEVAKHTAMTHQKTNLQILRHQGKMIQLLENLQGKNK